MVIAETTASQAIGRPPRGNGGRRRSPPFSKRGSHDPRTSSKEAYFQERFTFFHCSRPSLHHERRLRFGSDHDGRQVQSRDVGRVHRETHQRHDRRRIAHHRDPRGHRSSGNSGRRHHHRRLGAAADRGRRRGRLGRRENDGIGRFVRRQRLRRKLLRRRPAGVRSERLLALRRLLVAIEFLDGLFGQQLQRTACSRRLLHPGHQRPRRRVLEGEGRRAGSRRAPGSTRPRSPAISPSC